MCTPRSRSRPRPTEIVSIRSPTELRTICFRYVVAQRRGVLNSLNPFTIHNRERITSLSVSTPHSMRTLHGPPFVRLGTNLTPNIQRDGERRRVDGVTFLLWVQLAESILQDFG
eukprot:1098269-Pyramimonas_sp.AAC.1